MSRDYIGRHEPQQYRGKPKEQCMSKALLRLPQVRQHVGLSRSELYRLIKLGRFPRPVPLGERARAWDADEVERWIGERIAARDKETA
jgi:prophage regulatory protein